MRSPHTADTEHAKASAVRLRSNGLVESCGRAPYLEERRTHLAAYERGVLELATSPAISFPKVNDQGFLKPELADNRAVCIADSYLRTKS